MKDKPSDVVEKNIKKDIPVFPMENKPFAVPGNLGITLRDYFACNAMCALVISGQLASATTASAAFEMADVMLEIRND